MCSSDLVAIALSDSRAAVVVDPALAAPEDESALAVPFTLDLTFVTNAYASRTYQTIPLLIVAAVWYIIITSILMVGQHYLERYYGRGFDDRSGGKKAGRGLSRRQQAILDAHTVVCQPRRASGSLVALPLPWSEPA